MKSDITSFSDYRQYIKEFYESNKERNPAFSFRYLADKAGINSAPFYKFIIEGKRNLTKATILKTCAMLQLSGKEAEYFENLVFFNQAKTLKEKNLFFARMQECRKGNDVKKITPDEFEYFANWYNVVVRELATMTDFNNDYSAIARLMVPAIKPSEVKKAIDLMEKLGLLVREGKRFVQKDPLIATGNACRSLAVINFQIEMLKNAMAAYDRFQKDNLLMSSTTFSVSEQTFNLMKERIRDFRTQLMDMAKSDPLPERVLQLNLNLFPLSHKVSVPSKEKES